MATILKSPLSGRVVTLCAELQATVASGDALLIVESMKMEIPVEAEGSARVAKFLVDAGDEVTEGQPLVELQ
ncbi:acetyl-CoA carboxylase biotin carboxyl carrier protein subunit [Diaphorobacter aerolatus]|uniref:Acetyl-CoA carboxylase biotin carboxyl carrier protein subunit n=1 Tax=Diaphorobacter aerolatus TaxID=1288495 RepID=A0A7H0GGK6_9BURK|nr:acetyl-CoA carboxylase biotin carboxyl carrier protein subunit [Diaphorobacter aerolatus]QNP47422.1 acetyl-CoA carboxylase biotin carboxyl carrier protein subunit [Diaphorobacter aerolatus]